MTTASSTELLPISSSVRSPSTLRIGAKNSRKLAEKRGRFHDRPLATLLAGLLRPYAGVKTLHHPVDDLAQPVREFLRINNILSRNCVRHGKRRCHKP